MARAEMPGGNDFRLTIAELIAMTDIGRPQDLAEASAVGVDAHLHESAQKEDSGQISQCRLALMNSAYGHAGLGALPGRRCATTVFAWGDLTGCGNR